MLNNIISPIITFKRLLNTVDMNGIYFNTLFNKNSEMH